MKTKFSEFVVGDYANRLIVVLERIAIALEEQNKLQDPQNYVKWEDRPR